MAKKPGRPVGESDARQRLIQEARRYFFSLPYHRVSTRVVAESADVNIALIRYYFGNKAGLFDAMLRDSSAPMVEKLKQAISAGKIETLTDVMQAFYRAMAPAPNLPALIMRSMLLDQEDVQRQTVERLFNDVFLPIQHMLFKTLQQKGGLQPGVDPELARLSFLSLMLFPIVMPPGMATLQGVTLDDEYIGELARHNAGLLKHGIFTSQGVGEDDPS